MQCYGALNLPPMKMPAAAQGHDARVLLRKIQSPKHQKLSSLVCSCPVSPPAVRMLASRGVKGVGRAGRRRLLSHWDSWGFSIGQVTFASSTGLMGCFARGQVTQEVPELANRFLGGIPRTLDVKGLELNISLAGDPLVAADALVVRDWGRFQSPFAETGTQSLIRRGPGAAAGAAAAAVAEGREEAEALGGVRAAPAHGASDAAGSDQAHVDGRIEEEVWGSGSGVGTAGAAAGNWEECPYRRALSDAVLGGALSGGGGEGNRGGNTTADPMIIGLVDQSITNWCGLCPARAARPLLCLQTLSSRACRLCAFLKLPEDVHMYPLVLEWFLSSKLC